MRTSTKSLRRTAGIVTCLAVGAGSLAGCSSSGTAASSAEATPSVSKEAGIVTAAAGFLLKNVLAGAVGYGAVQGMNKIFGTGGGTDLTETNASLDALKSQVDGVSTQVGQVANQIRTVVLQVDALGEDAAMRSLVGYSTDVATVYSDYFTPMVDAAVALQKAKVAGSDTATLQADYDAKKADFKSGYGDYKIASIPALIHKNVMPST